MVILDTCALIELCKPAPTFSSRVYRLIKEADVVILSVSFAEIACKIKVGKLMMPIPVEVLFHTISQISNFSIADVSVPDWLDSVALDWPGNQDPADRLIIAHARRLHTSVVSTDGKMKRFYKKVIW